MIKGSQTERVYNFIKDKRHVTMNDIYKKFPNDKKPSLRRACFELSELNLVTHISEWRIK